MSVFDHRLNRPFSAGQVQKKVETYEYHDYPHYLRIRCSGMEVLAVAQFSCDVLIVGGGGGALRAAIAAKERCPESDVLLVSKGVLGQSGVTATACSDRMAFHATLPHTPPGKADNWRFHAEDIYRIGGQVSDWDLAEILAKESAAAYDYLDELGVPFVKEGLVPKQFATDGSEYPRACYTGPRTAVEIERHLLKRFRALGIRVLEHVMVAELIREGSKIIGALAIDERVREDSAGEEDGFIVPIAAKTVILATGGAGLIYKNNVFPAGMSGDGYVLAYEAGAELVNLEFIQIGVASLKTKLNLSGSLLRAVPRLVDETGTEFLASYFPPGTNPAVLHDYIFRKGASWPVSFEHDTRLIDLAISRRMREGHRVFLDYSHNPEQFDFGHLPERDRAGYAEEMVADFGAEARQASPLARLQEINPASVSWLKEHGINLMAGDKVEVAACGQHFQGGVKIGPNGESTLPGLYAVGEAAGGQHGANRPGGNALLDSQVFGKIAGEAAARESRGIIRASIPAEVVTSFRHEMERLSRNQGERPDSRLSVRDARKGLQEIVDASVGVVRTEAGLRRGLAELEKLRNKGMTLAGLPYTLGLETRNMFTVAEMVMRAALERNESRGPHLRFSDEDSDVPLPRLDPEWQRYLVLYRKEGEMVVEGRAPIKSGCDRD
ncbi:L-aspartate oxidase [Peptococcaceae bacterium CEB3]|nr:L-aspartate oxidase [Peptococcaceae bacterium CEB3]